MARRLNVISTVPAGVAGVETGVMMVAGETDPELVSRCRGGSQAACAELHHRLFPKVFWWARSYGLSYEDAEDVAQETVAKVLQTYDEDRAAVRTYAFGIAGNAAISVLRSRGRASTWLEEQGSAMVSLSDGTQLLDAIELSQALRDCLERVSRRSRQIIWLVAEGFSQVDTAEVLDIPVGTVYATYHRSRRTVGRCLQEAGVAP